MSPTRLSASGISAADDLGELKQLPRRITMIEACRVLGVSRALIERLRKDDPSFPRPFRYSDAPGRGRLLFDLDELLRWSETRREPQGGPDAA